MKRAVQHCTLLQTSTGNLQKIMQCSIAHLLTMHHSTECSALLPTLSAIPCNAMQCKTHSALHHCPPQVQCLATYCNAKHSAIPCNTMKCKSQCNAGAPVQCTRTAHLAETGGADKHSPGAGGGAGVEHSALQCNNVIVNSDAIVFTMMQWSAQCVAI